MRDLLLIHHAARGQHPHPPNSLSAVRDCVEAGARIVEVDVSPLADGAFALLHEGDLENRQVLSYLNRLSSLLFALARYEDIEAGVDNPTFAKES